MPLCSGLFCLPQLSTPLPTIHAKHCPFSQPLLTPGKILRRGLIIVVPLGGGTDVWLWCTNMRFRLKYVRGVYKWSWSWCGPNQEGFYPGCISALYPLHTDTEIKGFLERGPQCVVYMHVILAPGRKSRRFGGSRPVAGLFFGLSISSQIKTQRLIISYECSVLSYSCPTSSYILI